MCASRQVCIVSIVEIGDGIDVWLEHRGEIRSCSPQMTSIYICETR